MIRFTHHTIHVSDPSRYYGVFFDIHPERKALDIYFGKHVFVFWGGRKYK